MTANPLLPQFYQALKQSERLSPEQLRRQQRDLLVALVRHAALHVPFYRDSGRLAPLLRADGNVDLTRWDEVPVLTRAEAAQHARMLVALHVPVPMRPVVDDQTSGSTGLPLPFKRTALADIASAALMARAMSWYGPAPQRLAIFISARRRGDAPGGPVAMLGPRTTVNIGTEIGPVAQAEQLRQHRPSHIFGLPNVLRAVAQEADRPFEGVKLVMLAGEALRPETRTVIGAAFGCRTVDVYSASELGPIAIEGPLGGLRIAEEAVWLEHPMGATDPVPVTITPLHSYAMPLIRYQPGDYVRFADSPDSDAPGLRRLGAIIGRERNLLLRPDGSRFAPEISGFRLAQIAPIHAWRLTQYEPGAARLEMVFAEIPDAMRLAAVKAFFEAATAPISVEVQPVPAILDDRRAGKSYELVRSLL